jgi:penicillin amidase
LPIIDRLHGIAGLAALVLRAIRLPAPPIRGLDERLRNLPVSSAPVLRPVDIRWDEHALPLISAQNMPDLATGLGMVHAHLRLAQMEIARRLAQGRICEMIGAAGLPYDMALRTLDICRAVPGIIEMLPDESRQWAEAFLAGLNHVIAHAPEQPLECRLLNIEPAPWTMYDLFCLARLASMDMTWMPALKLLRVREKMPPAAWQKLWSELLENGAPNPDGIAAVFTRGSNSVAVGGGKTASGAGLIASDPHVGLQLPSIWLACSIAAPGFAAAGLMLPGIPNVAIGRNQHIAWGATNLHAASSVFVDLATESEPQIRERTSTILLRGGGTRTVTLRESRFGPIISDAKFFGLRKPTALSWIGHRPSDELTAMLALNRAENFEQFSRALESFAVQGYSFTYADCAGNSGIVRAGHVPARTHQPSDLIEPAATSAEIVSLAATTARFNPIENFTVSANEDPGGPITAGFFFAPFDRARRLAALLEKTVITLADMKNLQTDVTVTGAVQIRDAIAARAETLSIPLPPALLAWNGDYSESSTGALAYEIMIGEASRRVIATSTLAFLLAAWTSRGLVAKRLLAASDAKLRPVLAAAARTAVRVINEGQTWGSAHQLRLAHPLARLPIAGKKFTNLRFAVPGANDTIYKMGHPPIVARNRGSHRVTYGASARHIADLSALDANFVVLLGGQDGWINSTTATDQIAIWRRGEFLHLPLTTPADGFSRLTQISPPETSAAQATSRTVPDIAS